jgi:hypothetical protein
MRNGFSIRLLLIFALLVAQMGGLTHAISHVVIERTSQGDYIQTGDQLSAHQKHCDLCDAYTQIANAINSSFTGFVVLSVFGDPLPDRLYTVAFLALFPFAARAPPSYSV